MIRVLPIALITTILALGLFADLLGPTSYAPVPYCGPTASFQPTFALTDSPIVFLAEDLSTDDTERIGRLEVELDTLRRRLAIPGFSAAVLRNQRVIWARGFGCANIAAAIPATPHTPYHLASLTKPFAVTILLALVEEGLVDLDDPIADYGIGLDSPGTIRVKHLLSHTSEGIPGSRYRYHGDRFGLIDRVMESVTGKAFRKLLTERILLPLDTKDTLPTPVGSEVDIYRRGEADPRFQDAWDRLAKPYWLVKGYGNVEHAYAKYFGSAAGLISSVMDYAEFDAAIDRHTFISEETQEIAWTPFVANNGRSLPYGYGWFIQERSDLRYVWHYGYWDCTSTLILKVPKCDLTFLIFANSDRLSRPFGLGAGNIHCSPAARAFLDSFIEGGT